jgi:hypothetical protein
VDVPFTFTYVVAANVQATSKEYVTAVVGQQISLAEITMDACN